VAEDRARVAPGSPFEPVVGFSRAVRVGERVLVAGLLDPRWRVEIEAEAVVPAE
jgi:hypothetical protein